MAHVSFDIFHILAVFPHAEGGVVLYLHARFGFRFCLNRFKAGARFTAVKHGHRFAAIRASRTDFMR